MRRAAVLLAVAGLVLLAACARQEEAVPPTPEPGTPEWKIASALSAAPEAVASGAQVEDWPASDTAQPAVLRQGSNGWTCMPDDPNTPVNDPGCADDEMSRYWESWMRRTPPRLTGLAVGYALQGFQVASLTDPFRTAPDSGQAWIDVPPSVMMAVPARGAYAGLPTAPSPGPWVLWSGSGYAVIIVPAGTTGR